MKILKGILFKLPLNINNNNGNMTEMGALLYGNKRKAFIYILFYFIRILDTNYLEMIT